VKKQKLQSPYSGLVVFDVDGVIFRDIFLIRVARSTGLKSYLKTLFLGWRYYTNSISFEYLLHSGLSLIKDFDAIKAREIAHRIRKSSNIKKTIELLHARDFYVTLMSSGIPDFILKSLAQEVGADHYSGLDVRVTRGNINVDRVNIKPKEDIVGELLQLLGLSWDDVVSVVDDPNNLVLLQRSSLGIGFNPSKIIRQHADVVVEGYNLLELIPHIVPKDQLPERMVREDHLLRRETYRKVIHLLGVPLPFLALLGKNIVLIVLFSIIALYAVSEVFRYIGFHFPLVSYVTKRVRRLTESRGLIIGPISLTVGIIIPLLFFRPEVYIPAILIVCISDSISSLVGKRYGKTALPFYNRTVEGSAAFYISAFIILLFFLPVKQSLYISLIPTTIELVSPYHLDNFFIPVITALCLNFFFM
jgi:dolichol kinase/phosphoserine phosphatase